MEINIKDISAFRNLQGANYFPQTSINETFRSGNRGV